VRNRLEILLQREVRGPGHVSYCCCIWRLGLLISSLRCVLPKISGWRSHADCCQTQGYKLFLASEGLESGVRSKQLSEEEAENLPVLVTGLHMWMGRTSRGLVFSAERHHLKVMAVIELFS